MHRTRAPPMQHGCRQFSTRMFKKQDLTDPSDTTHPTPRRSMSKLSRTSLVVFCAAFAACAGNDTNRSVTAPDSGASFNEVPGDLRGGATMDGPMDLTFAPAAAATQMAASAQAASGGRASGHVAFAFTPPWFGVASEQYSFVALRTDPLTPYAAKGQYDMTLTTATGVVQEFHGKVICMTVVGNTARVVGQLTSVVVNGIPRPINPNGSHNIWNLTDNGEGNGSTDTASPMIFFPASVAPLHCANDFIPPQFASQAGNVQVK